MFSCDNKSECEVNSLPGTDNSADPTEQRHKPESPPAGNPWGISYVKRKFHERRAKHEAQSPEQEANHRTANATVVIAWFTIILALVGAFTLYEVIDGGTDTHKLAVAAVNQAYAVCVNAQISRRALIEVQRTEEDSRNATRAASSQAMVAVESAAPVISVRQTGTPTFTDHINIPLDFRNIGKTDARNVRGRVRAVFIDRTTEPDFIYKVHRGVDFDASVLRVGDGTTTAGSPITVSVFSGDDVEYMVKNGDFAAYQSGKKDVILYGFVLYHDIFNVPHWNYFCKAYQVFKVGLLENNGHETCSDYNKVDANSPVNIRPLGIPRPNAVPDIECTPPTPEPPATKKWFWPN